jgi:hypothetical protein
MKSTEDLLLSEDLPHGRRQMLMDKRDDNTEGEQRRAGASLPCPFFFTYALAPILRRKHRDRFVLFCSHSSRSSRER